VDDANQSQRVHLRLPQLSFVVLIGPSGAGKSTFALKHFKPTEVLSSDRCRGLVADDENAMDASDPAFAVLHFIARQRLARGRLTVIDATNVQKEARASLVALAREFHVLPVAVVFDLPERLCQERNQQRPDRDFGPHVIRNQLRLLRQSRRTLEKEGFRHVFTLESVADVDGVSVEREPLWNDLRHEAGPFDIIGDVHGCFDELTSLLQKLGYGVEREDAGAGPRFRVSPPAGRKAVLVGDLVDRGPKTPEVLRLVMDMVADGHALCVPGNHEIKLLRKLKGKDVRLTHGLAESMAQLEREPAEFSRRVQGFIDDLVSHYVLDGGRLVVAHAGLPESMHGRGSGKVRAFALYGDTTGETDAYGLPVRYPWAQDYKGKAMVVYGHTPVPQAEWLNRTICIDTGCVFGGRLTALRYPEKELVSVEAAATYYQPVRPLVPPATPVRSAQQENDDLLDLEDVLGKRVVQTRLISAVTIREENATAALEVMSRFAINPRWLIHLPPTMSPSETSRRPDYLEHPTEALEYFRAQGVSRVLCEEKHMGSRAVVVVCRDGGVAQRRFGVIDDGGDSGGACYTRTGRRFFTDLALEAAFLARLREVMTAANLWQELETDWVCLDTELMPWSMKAQELLRSQYAATGSAGAAALAEVEVTLAAAAASGLDVAALASRMNDRRSAITDYTAAYRRYCWPVSSLDDIRLAPFHVLASEGRVHSDKDHLWHMTMAEKLAVVGAPFVQATRTHAVDLTDADGVAGAVSWWDSLTSAGGEGMVVKPQDFITRGARGLVQPALKCRGPEYLRLIYGPEYRLPHNLERLRGRNVGTKRSLAQREFALGIEALERFVRREPLRRVHECVFAVLALQSEPVDPRL
jgi:protein phosphatase